MKKNVRKIIKFCLIISILSMGCAESAHSLTPQQIKGMKHVQAVKKQLDYFSIEKRIVEPGLFHIKIKNNKTNYEDVCYINHKQKTTGLVLWMNV